MHSQNNLTEIYLNAWYTCILYLGNRFWFCALYRQLEHGTCEFSRVNIWARRSRNTIFIFNLVNLNTKFTKKCLPKTIFPLKRGTVSAKQKIAISNGIRRNVTSFYFYRMKQDATLLTDSLDVFFPVIKITCDTKF